MLVTWPTSGAFRYFRILRAMRRNTTQWKALHEHRLGADSPGWNSSPVSQALQVLAQISEAWSLMWEGDRNSSIMGKQRQAFAHSLIPHGQDGEDNETVRYVPHSWVGDRHVGWGAHCFISREKVPFASGAVQAGKQAKV